MIQIKDSYGKLRFVIEFLHGGKYEVCADHLQEAIDWIIDSWDDSDIENSSHFMSPADQAEHEKDNTLECFIQGGNACLYTTYTGFDIAVTSEEDNPFYDFWTLDTKQNIERIFNVIDKTLFTITGKLTYDRVGDALEKLVEMMIAYEGESESLDSIGEFGNCTLLDLLEGAYWHYTGNAGNQFSRTYELKNIIGEIYSPGMGCGDEENAAYQALHTLDTNK